MAASNADVQRLAQRSRAMQEQLQEILEQRESLRQLERNLRTGQATLEALRGVDEGEEVLLPVGGGAFVRAHLADPGHALVDLGSDVVVEDDLETALSHVGERLDEVADAAKQLNDEAQRIQQDLRDVEAAIQQAIRGEG